MIELAFFLILLVLPFSFSQQKGILFSKNPILLNLKRSNFNDTGLVKLPKGEVRTKETFFLDTLGIEKNKPSNFDMDKWVSIQKSGLFRNLTAKAMTNENDEIILKISGEELPSLFFAPEISVAANLENPEISGGVSILCIMDTVVWYMGI